ncbi:hypothetical protein [Micromonospora globispora]|uniref:hypothetical protein n=1 Tax=Micromonospora globispora TaxID=1450148 RepID=UPI000F5EBAA4|nr:hypothetical protein [Micromonospora globispora]RQW96028.1 hypothetical protein DKL51_13865 [Micromonospora globispora]
MTSAARTAPGPDPEQGVHPASAVSRPSRSARLRGAAVRYRRDLLVGLLFVLFAGWLTQGLWPSPGQRMLALNPADQTLYEWFLAVDSRALLGDFSLLTDRLNAPDGVNLMTNTTVIALGVLFAPVTLLLGAPVTFALLAAGNLAGTAVAWYLLYTRTLRVRRLAAGLGAALCGFGPGMVSQTNSHLHMTAQWLVPVLVWLVVRLLRAADPAGTPNGPDGRRMATSSVGLAGVVTVQVFIGEEVLFLAALTLLVMAVAYGAGDRALLRRALPTFAGGLMVAAGLALVVLAYPLWFQFAGPQGVADGMFSPYYFSADLTSWWTISPLSVPGSDSAARLTTGPAARWPALPEFITGGHWRECVRPGGVLVPVPIATPKDPWPMRWGAAANAEFGMPEGFFIGPYGEGGSATMGTWKRPTSALLADVAERGVAPAVGDEQRRQAARDIRSWGASCVALTDDAPHAPTLRATLEELFGPATRVADAWIWRV